MSEMYLNCDACIQTMLIDSAMLFSNHFTSAISKPETAATAMQYHGEQRLAPRAGYPRPRGDERHTQSLRLCPLWPITNKKVVQQDRQFEDRQHDHQLRPFGINSRKSRHVPVCGVPAMAELLQLVPGRQ